MALSRQEKEALVAEVNQVATEALSLVGADYRGLEAEDLRELRRLAHEADVDLRVVKNTLARIAFKDTEFECANDALAGPMIFAFSKEDPGAAARIIKAYIKDHEELEPKVVVVGGELLSGDDLGRLASLPTREQALGQLAGVTLAPVSKFVRTLAEPTAQFVRVVAAVRDQKEAA